MSDFLIQRGTTDFGSSGVGPVTVNLPTSVDASRAFPRITNVRHGSSGRVATAAVNLVNRDLGVKLLNWNGSSFQLERSAGAETQDHRYQWEVWADETPSGRQPIDGWYVREVGALSLAGGTAEGNSSTIASIVNPSQCIPFPLCLSAAGTSQQWSDGSVSLEMDGQTVKAKRDTPSGPRAVTIYYAVVEFGSSWDINNNLEIEPGSTSELVLTGAGDAQPWSNKFLVPTNRVQVGSDRLPDVGMTARYGDDPDEIRVKLHAGANNPALGGYAMVCHTAYHPLLRVDHYDSFFGYNQIEGRNATHSLPSALSTDDAAVIATADCPGNVQYPGGHWGYELETTSIDFRRGRNESAINPCDWSAQVVRFFSAPRGGGGGAAGGGEAGAFLGGGHTCTSIGGGG